MRFGSILNYVQKINKANRTRQTQHTPSQRDIASEKVLVSHKAILSHCQIYCYLLPATLEDPKVFGADLMFCHLYLRSPRLFTEANKLHFQVSCQVGKVVIPLYQVTKWRSDLPSLIKSQQESQDPDS